MDLLDWLDRHLKEIIAAIVAIPTTIWTIAKLRFKEEQRLSQVERDLKTLGDTTERSFRVSKTAFEEHLAQVQPEREAFQNLKGEVALLSQELSTLGRRELEHYERAEEHARAAARDRHEMMEAVVDGQKAIIRLESQFALATKVLPRRLKRAIGEAVDAAMQKPQVVYSRPLSPRNSPETKETPAAPKTVTGGRNEPA